MLTLYKILVNLFYIISWPYWFVKQLSARQEWRQRRGFYQDALSVCENKDILWFHASSMGEVRVLERLIKAFEKHNSDISYIVSTYTTTGQELARTLFPKAQAVVFFPLDCLWVLRRVFKCVQPKGIVIVETEIWPYFLTFCKKRDVPVVLANGRLSKKSTGRYRKFSSALQDAFSIYRAVLVQSESDAKRYESIGVPADKIRVLGNLKHDIESIDDMEAKRKGVRERLGIDDAELFIVAASTRPGEEEIICDCLRRLAGKSIRSTVLLAPRHLERLSAVEDILRRGQFSSCRYSDYLGGGSDVSIVLMDKMGVLKELFYGADIVFVGGTMFDIGGHNIMEPVLAGVPVIYGPSVENVAEASEKILKQQWGRQVSSADELAEAIGEFYQGKISFRRVSSDGQSAAARMAEIIVREFGL